MSLTALGPSAEQAHGARLGCVATVGFPGPPSCRVRGANGGPSPGGSPNRSRDPGTSKLPAGAGRREEVAPIAADDARINDRIRARQVRLIGSDGTQYGVKALPEALTIAREQGLDLVEVAEIGRAHV